MNIANKVTTFRILSVPCFIACLVYYAPERDYLRHVALGIFLLAVLSDAVDGYIARKARQWSKAGSLLDPLADKLLLISAYVCLHMVNKFPQGIFFPVWVSLIVISRDVIILMGALVIYMLKQDITARPTIWGKATTTFQMLAVIMVLLQQEFSFLFWWAAVIFTLVSGADYIHRGFMILYNPDNHRNHAALKNRGGN